MVDNGDMFRPSLFLHSVQVYETMAEHASVESIAEGVEGLVYEGFTTQLIRNMGFVAPYYTKIFRELRRMRCIEQLRRGGSTSPSRWVLLRKPTMELWNNKRLETPQSATQAASQNITDLNHRVTRLEQQMAALLGEGEVIG